MDGNVGPRHNIFTLLHQLLLVEIFNGNFATFPTLKCGHNTPQQTLISVLALYSLRLALCATGQTFLSSNSSHAIKNRQLKPFCGQRSCHQCCFTVVRFCARCIRAKVKKLTQYESATMFFVAHSIRMQRRRCRHC